MNIDNKVQIFELHPNLVGQEIECEVGGHVTKNAKIQLEEGIYYICQNVIMGSECYNNLGYWYSWQVGDGTPASLERNEVFDIFIFTQEWDYDNN